MAEGHTPDGHGRARDVELLREALQLERDAVQRYVDHAAATSDPRLYAYWESLRRNEAGHRDELVAHLRRLDADVPADASAAGACEAAAAAAREGEPTHHERRP